MSAPLTAAAQSDERRWQDWLDRGIVDERRRAATMKGVVSIILIALSVIFGALL
jgi:hypothetical protein